MDINNQENPDKKRVLRKVRTQFLCKRPDEETSLVLAVPKPLNPGNINMLDSTAGLIEKDRKIFLGIRYLNTHLQVDNVTMNKSNTLNCITLNLTRRENCPVIPYEYTIKRLESYGDLELATWAHKIKTFSKNYPLHMKNYFDTIQSADPETFKTLEKARQERLKFQKHIETNYSYKKVKFLYRQDHTEIVSITFSEKLLKDIDRNFEDFAEWIKKNGIPALFNGNSPVHLSVGRAYLDIYQFKFEGFAEGPEFETFLYDMDGNKRKVTIQYVRAHEPTPEGLLVSGYIVIKKDEHRESLCGKERGVETNDEGERRKCKREDLNLLNDEDMTRTKEMMEKSF